MHMAERVQKIMSNAGYCSRRAAEKLIEEGRVKVNGKVAGIGDKAEPEIDRRPGRAQSFGLDCGAIQGPLGPDR